MQLPWRNSAHTSSSAAIHCLSKERHFSEAGGQPKEEATEQKKFLDRTEQFS